MLTMRTGFAVFTRGSMTWKVSKVLTRNSSIARGIGDAERGKSDQQSDAEQPRIAEPPLEPPSQYPQSLHAGLGITLERIDHAGSFGTPSALAVRGYGNRRHAGLR